MLTTSAFELGYTYQNIMTYYECDAINFYSAMVEAANAQHNALYKTARSLADNVYTKSASDELYNQANASKAQAGLVTSKLLIDYQLKVENIKKHWNESKVCIATINGQKLYYLVPYHAALNIINGNISINYVGNNYAITQITRDQAIVKQDENLWIQISHNTNNNQNSYNVINTSSGNYSQLDSDGDLVMGDVIIGDKITNNVVNTLFGW